MRPPGLAPPKDYDPDPPRKVDKNTWEDRQGRIYKYSPQTKDITMVYDPQKWTRAHAVKDEQCSGQLHFVDESVFEAVDAIISRFKDDRFILGPAGEEMAWLLLGGMERGMMEIADSASRNQANLSVLVSSGLTHKNEQYIRPGQDGVLWGHDLASQNGPMISPHTYRKLFLDEFRSRIQAVKQRNQFVIKHACGDNRLLLDIFVEMGIDCYQSIQGVGRHGHH